MAQAPRPTVQTRSGRTIGAIGGGFIRIDLSKLEDVGRALRDVANESRTRIIAMALNRTGDMAATQIKRVLVKETGLPAGRVGAALRKIRAGGGRLVYIIEAKSGWFPITSGNFGARETRKGVSHRAWGKSQTADGAFLAGSVAMTRVSKSRLPIKKLWGPNIAREMERGQSGPVAQATVRAVFIPRVLHEIDRSIKAAKARYGL